MKKIDFSDQIVIGDHYWSDRRSVLAVKNEKKVHKTYGGLRLKYISDDTPLLTDTLFGKKKIIFFCTLCVKKIEINLSFFFISV